MSLKEHVTFVFEPNWILILNVEMLISWGLLHLLTFRIRWFFEVTFSSWQMCEFLFCESHLDRLCFLPDLWKFSFLFFFNFLNLRCWLLFLNFRLKCVLDIIGPLTFSHSWSFNFLYFLHFWLLRRCHNIICAKNVLVKL